MRGTKKIDWLNHFLEFIVVVIGILLAFQLNTCREDQKEQELVQEHISNIIEETAFNTGRMELSIQASEAAISAIDSLTAAIQENENTAKIAGLSYQLLRFHGNYLKTVAYSSLKESGDIRFIKDFDERNDIVTLYEYYDWAKGIDDAAAETYNEYYYPYILNNFNMRAGLNQDEKTYTSTKFLNILTSYRYILQARVSQNKDTQEKMQAFLDSRK